MVTGLNRWRSPTLHAGPTVPDAQLKTLQKSYSCKVQLELQIWDWSDIRGACVEGQDTRTDAAFSHICVRVQFYLPDPSGPQVVRTISHFPSSQRPDRQKTFPQRGGKAAFCLQTLNLPLSGGNSKSHHACWAQVSMQMWLLLIGPVTMCLGTWPSCRHWGASGTRRHAGGYEASSKDR